MGETKMRFLKVVPLRFNSEKSLVIPYSHSLMESEGEMMIDSYKRHSRDKPVHSLRFRPAFVTSLLIYQIFR